jgi:hypothetical protein
LKRLKTTISALSKIFPPGTYTYTISGNGQILTTTKNDETKTFTKGNPVNLFLGSWTGTVGAGSLTVTFTSAMTYTLVKSNNPSDAPKSGTYTNTGNTATLSDPSNGEAKIYATFVDSATITLVGGSIDAAVTFTKGNPANPFLGSWTGTVNGFTLTVAFTSETEYTLEQSNQSDSRAGTYTYSGNIATLSHTAGTGPAETATVTGNTVSMNMTNGDGPQTPFTLTKQP